METGTSVQPAGRGRQVAPSQADERSNRYHSLDALRGAAMILGVWIHASASYFTRPRGAWPFRDVQQSDLLTYMYHAIHLFRMPLFFVMSGFFAALLYTRRGPWKFVLNRTRRVLVPLLVAWLALVPLIRTGILYLLSARSPEPLAAVGAYIASGHIYVDNLYHLWFLYDLVILYILALVAVSLSRFAGPRLRARLTDVFRRILQSAWAPVVLGIPTAMILETMPWGVIRSHASFVPDPRVLAAYGLFFGFGWLLHANADVLSSLARHPRRRLVFAALLFPIFLAAYAERGVRGSLPHLLTSSTVAVMIWLCVFGLTGLALRYLNRPRPAIRYLSDASYWLYLAHYPLVIWIAGALSLVDMPGELKALTNVMVTVTVLLVAYHYLVRPTLVGLWLNGQRVATNGETQGRRVGAGLAPHGRT